MSESRPAASRNQSALSTKSTKSTKSTASAVSAQDAPVEKPQDDSSKLKMFLGVLRKYVEVRHERRSTFTATKLTLPDS